MKTINLFRKLISFKNFNYEEKIRNHQIEKIVERYDLDNLEFEIGDLIRYDYLGIDCPFPIVQIINAKLLQRICRNKNIEYINNFRFMTIIFGNRIDEWIDKWQKIYHKIDSDDLKFLFIFGDYDENLISNYKDNLKDDIVDRIESYNGYDEEYIYKQLFEYIHPKYIKFVRELFLLENIL